MKLIMCQECHDVVALVSIIQRQCLCGKSTGQYVDDINANVSGPCDVLGFNNRSLANALVNPRQDYGTPFEAFIIPNSSRTIKRIPQLEV